LAPSSGSRQGDCRDVVPIASVSGSASYCDRGCVAFLNATYPMSPSGLMDCDGGCVAFLKATWPMSPSHRVAPDAWLCDRGYVAFLKATHPLSPSGSQCNTRCVAFSGSGLKARAPEPFPLLSRLSFPPLFLSPSRSFPAVLGCLPRVEVAVLRRVSLRSCRGRVRAVRRRHGLCRIEKVTAPLPPSQSRGRLCFRRFRFPLYCTRGTCASSLVRSHTSRSPGARHLRACPVREVVTVTWDPRPREPVEGVLRATSVLELAAA
ncbi:hypothetical protein Taro_035291, partial [Colocasia esculenta]|nr:hypothetical protein [Colocasia esculenta]